MPRLNVLLLALFFSLFTQDRPSVSPPTVAQASIAPSTGRFFDAEGSLIPSRRFAPLSGISRHSNFWKRLTRKTRFLLVVTTDGLRWQEVFGGADSLLLAQDPEAERLHTAYAHPDVSERRRQLLPFFWSTLCEKGQLYGNRHKGNFVNVANNLWFSYPGYNELFCGRPDDLRIFTNAKMRNPNPNVLEFLNGQPELHGHVAAITSWEAFPYILNEKRSGFPVFSASENRPEMLDPNSTPDPASAGLHDRDDAFTWAHAFRYVQEKRPKVLFISFNDTDERAHEGHYGPYLDAARRVDERISELWQWIQHDPEYRNRTTLLITTDHGRGRGSNWRHHHAGIAGSDQMWFAVIGPDTPALGEVDAPMQLRQQQLTQTMAQLMGFTFRRRGGVAQAVETVWQESVSDVLADKSGR